jgi:topoisomerase-4 subunit B
MSKYDAASIEVLTGLEPVRKRPGMYTETERPNHLAQEVIDNSVDEAMAGFASKIVVTLHTNNAVTVSDNGRGMPTDIHPEQGVSGVEVILTKLHAGGKFSNDNYQFSGGLHGVGISVVNALSTQTVVTIKQNAKIYEIEFANGDLVNDLKEIGTTTKKDTGTMVKFTPDSQFFDTIKFSVSKLRHSLRSKAILCPNLEITFINENEESEESWLYENGISDYLHLMLNDIETLPKKPYTFAHQDKKSALDISLSWISEGSPTITESYVNLITTILGGTHVNGLRSGLTDALKEFCDFRKLTPKGLKITPDDVWKNLNYVLSIKMLDPQFSGQTKERLSSREAAGLTSNIVKDAFSLWLNDNVELATEIANLIIDIAQFRSKSAKKIVRKKIVSGPALPGKLSDCTSHDLAQTEVFLVEGDSAGGSAKQARDKEHQAILPLRGKILNSWEVNSNEVLASKEIHDISVAIGLEPDNDDLSQLRYGKICILADADSDGAHIATLICALFVKHFPALVRAGHVYAAMPPLYRIDAGKKIVYALDEAEKDMAVKKLQSENSRTKIQVQRFKGLGEMNPSQLRETTMHPDTRRLVQLTLEEFEEPLIMDMLLSKKRASDRKSWLEQKGNLAEVLT